ncbi:hypothetical protein [Rubrobacter calidifluminis]|uniref:hypothetical protein n=1 Tax=Rubrobacter calidifluminis TaxID=1392640 RepID=UPI002361BC21|nr:hypothetical protein [Rubrobacter calidifluminis]
MRSDILASRRALAIKKIEAALDLSPPPGIRDPNLKMLYVLEATAEKLQKKPNRGASSEKRTGGRKRGDS